MIGQQAYQKFADAIAVDFIDNKIPLNDSILKIARTQDLNQEQIRRLCEATNNVTFNKLFQHNKNASDRIVEFDVADAKIILNNLIKNAEIKKEEIKTASSELAILKDEMHEVRHPEPVFEKTASNFELRPDGGQLDREMDQRTVAKTLEHLRSEKIACDIQYRDSIAVLQTQFKQLYNSMPFEAFEKSAIALYGEEAIPHLSVLRGVMNKPEVNYNIASIEKAAGFIDDSSDVLQAFKEVINVHRRRERHSAAINKLENL